MDVTTAQSAGFQPLARHAACRSEKGFITAIHFHTQDTWELKLLFTLIKCSFTKKMLCQTQSRWVTHRPHVRKGSKFQHGGHLSSLWFNTKLVLNTVLHVLPVSTTGSLRFCVSLPKIWHICFGYSLNECIHVCINSALTRTDFLSKVSTLHPGSTLTRIKWLLNINKLTILFRWVWKWRGHIFLFQWASE